MKVLLQVALSPYSGYGLDGIGMARAFQRMGADVYLAPYSVQAPLPPEIAALLCKDPEAPFDLFVSHLDPSLIEVSDAIRRSAKLAVGWTMWEYTSFDNLPGRKGMHRRIKNFDALLSYDSVTQGCFEPIIRDETKLLTLQGGFDPRPWQYIERDWHSDRFGFCMNGALSERKDPFVAIEAFRQLKEEHPVEFEPAELHLKTSIRTLHPGIEEVIPKVRIHYDIWPTDVLQQFYAAQHVLLAPSRGEGKNVPALEFQATGGAVIATNWGGHQQWLHPSYAYPLDYELHPVDPRHPNSLNARASVQHLKELMLHTFRNREEVKQKALLASHTIPKIASWDSVVHRLLLQLKESVPGGQQLWDKASHCTPEDNHGRS
jgi:glycosyltransferase involved in cell wall biosynthesis